ncbi:hypothetical protein [Paenibacillus stellifer]|uniref:hypothetical protein n=1 Tax=Paenibacillus stellifer TaxID=169760 RepID=UPI0014706F81|nr:hypothetical protein [Paenibacillus stellifer]
MLGPQGGGNNPGPSPERVLIAATRGNPYAQGTAGTIATSDVGTTYRVKHTTPSGIKWVTGATADGTHPNYGTWHQAIALRVDKEGYTSFQIWDLMQRLGPFMGLGKREPFKGDMIFLDGRQVDADAP